MDNQDRNIHVTVVVLLFAIGFMLGMYYNHCAAVERCGTVLNSKKQSYDMKDLNYIVNGEEPKN